METTNSIINEDLYNCIKPQSVLSWIRAIVANQIAQSGIFFFCFYFLFNQKKQKSHEWIKIFGKYNSGTCNNQVNLFIKYKKN